jgi:hypothetical protein
MGIFVIWLSVVSGFIMETIHERALRLVLLSYDLAAAKKQSQQEDQEREEDDQRVEGAFVQRSVKSSDKEYSENRYFVSSFECHQVHNSRLSCAAMSACRNVNPMVLPRNGRLCFGFQAI